MGRTALRGQESGSGAQSLRSLPTSGRVASPRPLTSNCHRGSEPRRRPELRRAVPRHLGMAPPRAALGERDQPRGLARRLRTPPVGPWHTGRAAMLRGSHRVVACGGHPPGSTVGVSVAGTGVLLTGEGSVTLGGGGLVPICAAATQSAVRQVAAQSSRRETPNIVSSGQASRRKLRRAELRPALRPPAAPPPTSPPRGSARRSREPPGGGGAGRTKPPGGAAEGGVAAGGDRLRLAFAGQQSVCRKRSCLS